MRNEPVLAPGLRSYSYVPHSHRRSPGSGKLACREPHMAANLSLDPELIAPSLEGTATYAKFEQNYWLIKIIFRGYPTGIEQEIPNP